MFARVWLVAGLLLVSGFCALVYQVAWLREFRLVFGGSTTASAAVLAVFMGGLGVGNWLLGARADRHPSPLRWYAQLELAIALTAALSPRLIDATQAIYAALGGQSTLGVIGATLARLTGTMLVLGVPTILMGGTLPAAAKAVVSAKDTQRRAVGLVYGWNTLGAVLGTLVSTFALLPALGTRTTLFVACLLNIGLALAAWQLSRGSLFDPSAAPKSRERKSAARAEVRASTLVSRIESHLIYATAFVVGCVFFLMELVWYRMLTPLLGGSTFTFGLILACALAGIGIGGALYPLLYRRRSPSPLDFATTCALQALCVGIPFALGDRFALWGAQQLAGSSETFVGLVFAWSNIAAAAIFPASLISGAQFPILIGLVGQGEHDVGRQVGKTVALNTLGCIVGSLLGGFGLMPLLSAPGVWKLAIALLLLTAVAWLLLSYRAHFRLRWLLPPALATVGALAIIFSPGPSVLWRHTAIGAGRSSLAHLSTNDVQATKNLLLSTMQWEHDGVESSLAIRGSDALALYNNGKSDGDAIGDAATQIMIGMVPALLHEQPRTALVIGLGTGETAGWLGACDEIERVDCVELEPGVLKMAELCALANHDVLNNPKVNVLFNDARETLTTTRNHYDLIVSEPSNPYRAGVANLFTQEFYRSARNRLSEKGIFAQWLQAYEVDAETIGIVLHTLRQEFPHVELWQMKPHDLLLVASTTPPKYDIDALRTRVDREPYRKALGIAWRAAEAEGFLSGYIGGTAFVDQLASAADGQINTDDHNLLEYRFAKTVGAQSHLSTSEWRNDSVLAGTSRPQKTGAVDWERVIDYALLAHVDDQKTVPYVSGLSRAQTSRWLAVTAQLDKKYPEAIAFWDQQPREPETSTELVSLAIAMLSGDQRARGIIARLRELEPVEGDSLLGLLALRDGQYDEATELCEKCFLAMRKDPWPKYRKHLYQMACRLADRDVATARRLYSALNEPFAVGLDEIERRETLLYLAKRIDDDTLVTHLETYEPNIPWKESFLELRSETYERANHRLAALARQQLTQFRRQSR